MPTYEYACDSCGHRFDIRQSFSEDPIRDCPVCGAGVRRVVYPTGVIFKGSGWYVNDSRSAATTPSASKPVSDSPGTAEKSDKKETVKSAPDS
ncbi:MAG TPA: zinc ribbon domain-containing protein [Thermomicrobiales bacterium]|jgi:putative FmdB family regulatory protein|nr:FmdB family transcriptional regulator [Chloroflexota bacterium]HCG28538.1 FmdB family transcriptional regulator [Chloroflexota bacterium]HQX61918.1 zinc ribbon domain-containing protein [Thermomicrobiales bacterium]HQZ90088.1 zinc ribbon domain-containing protein [Thermomicrobiales bacterium]HRA32714.1 zinc ribbon domain-containing protein [Thermomicrobiales bacterium]